MCPSSRPNRTARRSVPLPAYRTRIHTPNLPILEKRARGNVVFAADHFLDLSSRSLVLQHSPLPRIIEPRPEASRKLSAPPRLHPKPSTQVWAYKRLASRGPHASSPFPSFLARSSSPSPSAGGPRASSSPSTGSAPQQGHKPSHHRSSSSRKQASSSTGYKQRSPRLHQPRRHPSERGTTSFPPSKSSSGRSFGSVTTLRLPHLSLVPAVSRTTLGPQQRRMRRPQHCDALATSLLHSSSSTHRATHRVDGPATTPSTCVAPL